MTFRTILIIIPIILSGLGCSYLENDHTENQIEVNAFIIMSNHVHIIWQPLQHYTLTQIQTSFMTYTAKTIKKKLLQLKPDVSETLKVSKHDRTYQV